MSEARVYVNGPQVLPVSPLEDSVFVAHSFFKGDALQLGDYRQIYLDALRNKGYHVIFADEQALPGTLLSTICQSILNTEIGVYDITGYMGTTIDGFNENALIELGLAIGLNRPTAVLMNEQLKPAPAPLEPLEPVLYATYPQLARSLKETVEDRLHRAIDGRISGTFCASCLRDCPAARRRRVEPQRAYTLIGVDAQQDDDLIYHFEQEIRKFDMTPYADAAAAPAYPTVVCEWVARLRRTRVALFFLKKPYNDPQNAAVHIQVGIAAGLGTPWAMILPADQTPPTDLRGLLYINYGQTRTLFRRELGNNVRSLILNRHPDQFLDIYTPLRPDEVIIEEEGLDAPGLGNIAPESTRGQQVSKKHIFVSYSRQDSVIVQRLTNDLQAAGIEIWVDRGGLTPGTVDWEVSLRNAIEESSSVLLLASPSSRESRYVRDEIAIAEMYKLRIIPVWVAGESWADAVPLGLFRAQYIDMRGDRYAAAFADLLNVLNATTGMDGTDVAQSVASPAAQQVDASSLQIDESELSEEQRELLRRFRDTERQIQVLRDRFQNGEISRDQIQQELRSLMILDTDQKWWMQGIDTEKWYRFDGKEWVLTDPQEAFRAQAEVEATASDSGLPTIDSLTPEEYARQQLERLMRENEEEEQAAKSPEIPTRKVPVADPDATLSQAESRYRTPVLRKTSTYTSADTTFDEVYEIERDDNGEFLGECGVDIAEMAAGSGDGQKGATAFEVWIFDKVDIRTQTQVLASSSAFNDAAVRPILEAKGALVQAKVGAEIVLSTAAMWLRARVTEMVYDDSSAYRPESVIRKFTVELSVWQKEPDERLPPAIDAPRTYAPVTKKTQPSGSPLQNLTRRLFGRRDDTE